jgi:hypothetical protein
MQARFWRADREIVMTHITDSRAIGNHADMGGPPLATSRKSLTVTEILRAGISRRTRRADMGAAQSTWDSEGGAVEGEVTAREEIPSAPTRIHR